MTHDELLAKFTDYEAHFDQVRDEEKIFAMLRAVVELHKPLGWTCKECNKDFRDKDIKRFVKYPCPTIQAIEKEPA